METYKFDLDYINFQATAQELRKIAKELGVKNSSKYKKEILQAMSAEKLAENMEKEIEEGMTRQFNNQIQSSNNVEPKIGHPGPLPPNNNKELEGKKSSRVTKDEKVEFFTPFIDEEKWTKSEIVQKGVEKFPTLSKNSIETFLADAGNPKFNYFGKLIIKEKNEEGRKILKFE